MWTGLDCSYYFQRLLDLGKFASLSKTFERGHENAVSFRRPSGRLEECRQLQRRAQFEAPRALLPRDGDGGQESFFRGRGVAGFR